MGLKMNRFSKYLNNQGYTLVEIIIVIVILGVIGGITFKFVAYGVEAFKKSGARKELYDQGRLALERMVRELRDGKEITDCSSNSITFKKAHPAQAADNIEEVKFELDGTDLKRVGDPSGTPQTAILASNVTSFQVGDAGGSGSVTVDNVSSGTTVLNTDSTMTVSHTTGSGSDRLMLVGISVNVNDDERVTGVTYGGTSLTLVGERANSNDAMMYIYSLVAPNPGTADVVINFDSALDDGAIAGVMTFTGVDQSTPLGAFASAIGDDTAQASVDIASAPGELVFGVVACEYDPINAAVTGQDVQWNTTTTNGNYGAGGTDAGASTVAMTWGFEVADPIYNHWAIGGVSIKPSGSSGSTVCSGAGGITLDHVTARYNAGTGNLAHSISSGSGNNRLLVVCYAQENDNTITSMTYNGVNMTKIHRESYYSGTYNVTEMWYMLDDDMPSSAGTYDVSMTVTAGNGPGIVVLSFEGVAEQAPETHNASHYDDWASDRSITQISNVSAGSLVVSVASNGECCGYDGSVGGAGGAGIRQAEGEPSSAGMGVSTDLSSAGGTFNVTEISSTGTTTRRATHIVSAFAPAPASSPLVSLSLTLSSSEGGTVTMRTKVYMRNMSEPSS
jgi:prepilin-type N-terminal cleavage/methylation domain-containing protein